MDASDVCPPEDAIQTLLEYLVDPLLPAKSSVRDNPSESQQQLVAAQVHAVLLLYNYYHRKQHPHLKDGDFEWFSKLVAANRPALLAYMNPISDDAKSEVNQLSMTKKQIMDACNISKSLFALKGVPSTDWPISKVTVFLIDSSRTNCLLQFSSVTQGVWSVIEKDINAAVTKELNKKKTTRGKPSSSSNEVDFQLLAFSAIEEATRISRTDLVILEGHVSYSLCKEKSAACFYIMQCTLLKYDDIFQVPIKDAICSLQGPLLQKCFSGWMVSPVVEYFHLLPYAGILSDWQSGISSSNSFHSKAELGNVNINDYKKTEKPCNIEVPKVTCGFTGDSVMAEGIDSNKFCADIDSPEINDKNNGYVSDSSDAPDRLEPRHMVVDRSTIGANTKGRMVNSVMSLSVPKGKSEVVAVGNKTCNIKTSDLTQMHKSNSAHVGHQPNLAVCRSVKVAVGNNTCNNKTSDQVLMHKADSALIGHRPSPAKYLGEKVVVGDNICKTKTSDQVRIPKVDSALVGHQPSPAEYLSEKVAVDDNICETKTSDQVRMPKADSALVGNRPSPTKYLSEKVAVGDNICKTKTSDQVRMPKADSALVDRPRPAEYLSEKVAVGDNICKTKTTDQVRMLKVVSALVGHKSKPKNHGKPQTIEVSTKTPDQIQMYKADSDSVRQPNPKDLEKQLTIEVSKKDILSQTALKVLHRRRDKLTLELRCIEDEIAQCDRNIRRISNGSKDDFALKLESIIEGYTDVSLRNGIQERTREPTEEEGIPQYNKRKRLSEAVLSVQNPCQELDDICYGNNWILPTYRISSSDGGFEAKASMEGIDFECSSEGCLRSSPREARESAAAEMLIKLRRMAKTNPTLQISSKSG